MDDAPPHQLRDVVFFDGDCLFCQARVRWLRAHDRDHQFSFAPLQGELAARLLSGTGLVGETVNSRTGGTPSLSTMVFVVGPNSFRPEVLVKSRAVAAVAARLPFPWRLGGLAAMMPSPIADRVYDWVARRRHRWARVEAWELTEAGGVDRVNGG